MATTGDGTGTLSKSEALTGNAFQYPALGDGEIRVIHLHPGTDNDQIRGDLHIISVKESTIKPYSALSYTWGDLNQPQYPITLGDQKFHVRENLFIALKANRSNILKVLWIDAICINQQDEEEKAKQIPLMTQIYSKAQTVEIWLGPSLDDGELALTSISSGRIGDIATIEVICALMSLLQRPWFQRLWVIQELVLAAPGAAYVNCGSTRCSWDSFSTGVIQIYTTNNLEMAFQRDTVKETSVSEALTQQSSRLSLAILRNQLSFVMINSGIKICMLGGIRSAFSNRAAALGSDWKPAAVVGAILRMARYAISSYPEDKVFGLCGVFSDSAKDQLTKFYGKDSKEVYFATTSYILRHDTCPNLYHEFPTLSKSKSKGKVPSWTLDFSFTGSLYAEVGFRSFTKFNAPRSEKDKLQFSSDGMELTIDACIIDGINSILQQEQIVQTPDTADAWQQFLVAMLENDVVATLDLFSTIDPKENERVIKGIEEVIRLAQLPQLPDTIDGTRDFWIKMLLGATEKTLALFMSTTIARLVREFVRELSFITFLEKAQKLHEQATSDWRAVETIPPFWSAILAGLHANSRNKAGLEVPTGRELKEEIDILLGRKDDSIPKTRMRL